MPPGPPPNPPNPPPQPPPSQFNTFNLMGASFNNLTVQITNATKQLQNFNKGAQQVNNTFKGLSDAKQVASGAAGALGIPLSPAGIAAMMVGLGLNVANKSWEFQQRTAAQANPNLGSTLEKSQKLLDTKIGSENQGLLNYKTARTQQDVENVNADQEMSNTKKVLTWLLMPHIAAYREATGNWREPAVNRTDQAVLGEKKYEAEWLLMSEKDKAKYIKDHPITDQSNYMMPKAGYIGLEEYGESLQTAGLSMDQLDAKILAEQMKNMAGALGSLDQSINGLREAMPAMQWH
jgi:hypothetical protein